MDVSAEDLLPMLQQQLGALMVENLALRAQIQKLQNRIDNSMVGFNEGQTDKE